MRRDVAMTGSRFSSMAQQLLNGDQPVAPEILREYEPALRREIRFAIMQIQLAQGQPDDALRRHRQLEALMQRIEDSDIIEGTDE